MLHIFVFALFLVTIFEMVCIAFLFGRTADMPDEEEEQEERKEQKKRLENLNEIFDYDPYRR
jgi:hypothetical protein